MNTIKLYDEAPYETDFVARITDIDENTVTLDRTLFFPEEGGQTCDRGTIRCKGHEFTVTDVQIKKDICHTLDTTDDSLQIGDEVEGHIDWAHRFDNMQNHTGEHIFSGLVHSLKGYDNVGFSLTENTCQMDYNGKLTDDEITRIEAVANDVIWQAIPVDCRYPSSEELATTDYRSKKELTGPVRIVTIPGVDVCACCAPHVRTTAEVGLLKVISHLNYKGGTRLYIACGRRAFTDYVETFDSLTDIGHLFSTGRPDALDAVKKLISSDQELRTKLADSERDELFRQIDKNDTGVIFTKVTDRNILTAAFNHLKETHDGACYIFSEKPDGGCTFLAGGRDIDARDLMPALKEKLGAKGGGKADMIQGSTPADRGTVLLSY
ncbi:MAG: alanine--tRNA ligase-related protein [Lachnospiraceae bacterium]|nr:alanine--tRNA ligase-related protein [Lachnospiraceae bacterium]